MIGQQKEGNLLKIQGKHMGRKGQDEKQVKKALSLFAEREEKGLSVNGIVKLTGVARSITYAKIKEAIQISSFYPCVAWGIFLMTHLPLRPSLNLYPE